LEEERLEMEHKLLQAQKLEGLAVMAGGIAHDFNNQLTAVLGNLELALMDRALEPKARQNIENAITAAKRSAELSRQMQIYAGNALHLPVDLDLNELAHKNEELLKSAVSKTTTLHFEIDKGLPFICGDADQIQLIITNLIMNASEAIGDKDGDVTLTTGVMDCDEAYLGRSRLEGKPEPGRFVFLEVTDPGCGMGPETLHRLFDPFFTTKFWGRGLGMATVLGITKGHHGAIIVDSEVGKGTTIRVLFPASAQDRAPSLQDRSVVAVKDSRSDSGAGRKTILVVDDDEMVRDYCVEFLELIGYNTIAAVDGAEGVRIFRERLNEIDMVLLDFIMPRMNGVEAFGELIRIKPEVKVILSSGYTEDIMRQRFPGRQPASILHKPYDMETLKAELERLLGTTDRGVIRM
jgi:nitrogen-specific signal transduction histidine kinase/CheY-like chemotaxis protein